MNTDEVIREKFEKWTWMKYHWCGKSHEEVFARTTEGSHYDYVRGDIQDSWAAYQQATKESEAEIDRLLDSDRIEILVKDNDGFMSITKLSELDALKEADR